MQKMRVDIEKRYMGSYGRIAREANKSIKRVNLKIQKGKYQKLLSRKDISAETKKKKLARSLHELIINTFSVNINKIKNKKRTIDCLKANIALIREIIHKIKKCQY